MGKVKYIVLGFLTLLFILLIGSIAVVSKSHQTGEQVSSHRQETIQSVYITYAGEEGKTAQELLMKKGKVSLDSSGMVSIINSRVADTTKHEYWAFYINGKMSSVGAASYVTKNTDKIEWKIEKY